MCSRPEKNVFGLRWCRCVLRLLSPRGRAQAKLRIAIWDFENHAERSWWFYDQLGPAARDHIDTAFSEDLDPIRPGSASSSVRSSRWCSRNKVCPPRVRSISRPPRRSGKLLGIKLHTYRRHRQVRHQHDQGRLWWYRRQLHESRVDDQHAIHRYNDGRTDRVFRADGDVKKGGGFAKGASLSRDAEWGIASEAVEKASKAVVEEFVSR